jgi:indole-3-glycerol phosphate synthase
MSSYSDSPRTILNTIIDQKRKTVTEAKALFPVPFLERNIHFAAPTLSLKQYLQRADKVGIIAEIKRKSPSLGPIQPHLSVEKLSIGYMQAGASALSILTDGPFFGGSNNDLSIARKFNLCPILRKDFIIDEYQVLEAKSIGADVILLIAAVLTVQQTQNLARLAKSFGLEVLLEIHDETELEYWNPDIDLVGVNNRDLNTFQVNLETSFRLKSKLPTEVIAISESGLKSAETIFELQKIGFKGFLIGELFLSKTDPIAACNKLVKQIKQARLTI